MHLTLANKITVCRILVIPIFIWLAASYGASLREGAPDETWRWAAIAVFVAASLSDAVDGIVARLMNQRTRLGSILDPIADKALLVSTILTLSLAWPDAFPLWFPILVVGRDVLAVTLVLLANHVTRKVEIVPHWTGKCATFFQMVACGWVMLRIPAPPAILPIGLAGVFTFWSSAHYLREGFHHMAEHGGGHEEE